MKFNLEQERAFNEINEFLASASKDSGQVYLLTGYAGTGKTTLISHIITEQLKNSYQWVCMCAPTHKATNILKKKGKEFGGHNIDYNTLHQLLGLTAKIDYETGRDKFEPKGNSSLHKYDLVVVDECSMIDEELWEMICTQLRRHPKVKMVLLGDIAQLPPVNCYISPIFNASIPSSHLTEIMRINEVSNPLLTVTTNARNNELCRQSQFRNDLLQGVWIVENKRKWLSLIVKSFRSPKYKDNPDYCKAIAWTNKGVNWINNFVRDELLDYPDCPFVVGERLVANDAIHDYRDTSEVLATNSTEFVVEKVKLDKSEDGIPYYWLKLADDDGHTIPVKICLDDNMLYKKLGALADDAISARHPEDRKEAWIEYYDLKHTFSKLSYNYAITSHKSQGSTYNNCFVAQQNIMTNKNREEAFKSLYVAYSRASERLFINC